MKDPIASTPQARSGRTRVSRVENLVAFGSALVGQWYGRKSFLPTAAVIDDASHKS